MVQVVVTAPPGSMPGSTLQVSTPSGLAMVQVPPGVMPGQQFLVQVPAAQQRTVPNPAFYQQQQQRSAVQQQPTYQQPRAYQPFSERRSSQEVHSTGDPYRITRQRACEGQCYKCVCCDLYCPCCCCCCTKMVTCVYTGEVAVVEQYEKFKRVETAGEVLLDAPCGALCPFLNERIAKRLPLRVQELPVEANVKSRDNVFVVVGVRVLYRIPGEDKAYDAAYKLTDIRSQVGDYVEDVLRSFVATLDLDAIFVSTKEISEAVFERVSERLASFGFELVATLVTTVDPDPKVRASMNQINTEKRLKAAAVFNAEAEKAIGIKRAEAAAECKYLQGVGLARMRKALVDGLADTIDGLNFFKNDDDVASRGSDDDSTSLLLITQYMDTLEHVAEQQGGAYSTQGARLFLPVGVDVLAHLKQRLTLFLKTINNDTAVVDRRLSSNSS
mmetsp:Transcript_24698/g.76284  ORF Transcript_24698/g.76284 Transcript_24698/m.76284 type:complete len:443 (+) Transcript_24698:104-1432(+)